MQSRANRVNKQIPQSKYCALSQHFLKLRQNKKSNACAFAYKQNCIIKRASVTV